MRRASLRRGSISASWRDEQRLLRLKSADLSCRRRQSRIELAIELLTGRLLHGDGPLVSIEDRQFERGLRAERIDRAVVAAADQSDRKVGELREDRLAKLRILGPVAVLQGDEVGPTVGEIGEIPADALGVHVRGLARAGERQGRVGSKAKQRIELMPAIELQPFKIVVTLLDVANRHKIGRQARQRGVALIDGRVGKVEPLLEEFAIAQQRLLGPVA